MTTRPLPKLISLVLATALSGAWLGSIVTGMQSQNAPTRYSIELPTVVIVAHKASAQNTSAKAPLAAGQNS